VVDPGKHAKQAVEAALTIYPVLHVTITVADVQVAALVGHNAQ